MRHILQSKRAVLFLTTVGFMLYGFCGMFGRLRYIFMDPIEDMSFGWLVPVFSLYVLWTSRRELMESVGRPSVLGLLACLPCMAVALLGTRGLQVRLEQLGFVGLCIALPWAFFGWRTAKLCVFPAIFLLFTVPLSTFLDSVTIHLRLLASGTALAVLKGFGVSAVQKGTAIIAQGAHAFNIDVAEPCSGLRSLFALMALTAAYSWYTQPTWLRRILLFACSIPLAVLGNVVRILTICLCATWTSADFAMGFYHDYSGYVIFIVAIALMVACGEVIARFADSWTGTHGTKDKKRMKDEDDGRAFKNLACVRDIKDDTADKKPPVVRNAQTSQSSRFSRNSRFSMEDVHATDDRKDCTETKSARTWLAVAAVIVLAPLFVFQATTPVSMIMEPPEVSLPEKLPGYMAEDVFYCGNEQCAHMWLSSALSDGQTTCAVCGGKLLTTSIGESTILPKDTRILKRVYRRSADGVQFLVSVVIGGTSKSSIHRPELCMPAQGYVMSDPRTFTVADRPFHAIHLTGVGAPPSVLAYTFFNQAGVRTASHTRRILVDTWDRSVHNRIDRWVMVTVNASVPLDALGFDLRHDSDRLILEGFLANLSEALP